MKFPRGILPKAEYAYDAFGNAQIRKIANTTQSQLAIDYNPFRYRGYFYDVDMGMYYLQSRYYWYMESCSNSL